MRRSIFWVSVVLFSQVSFFAVAAEPPALSEAREIYNSYSVDNGGVGASPKVLRELIGGRISSSLGTVIFVKYKDGEIVIDGKSAPIVINERIKEVLFNPIRVDHPLVKYSIKEKDADFTIESTVVILTSRDNRTNLVTSQEMRYYYKVISKDGIIVGQDIYCRKMITLWYASKEVESKEIRSGWEL